MDEKAAKKQKEFFSSCKTTSYKKGYTLLRPEDKISNMHFLVKGSVRQYLITNSGEEITIHIFRPLSVFPIALILAKAPNRFYFETLTSVSLKTAPTKKVLAFVQQNSEVLLDLVKRFSKAIDGLTIRLENRVASLLIYLSGVFGEKTELNNLSKDIAFNKNEYQNKHK